MKTMAVAALFLTTLSTVAFAGTLDCTGTGLSLSERHSDGGANMEPTIQMVFNGDILVNKGLGKPETDLAYSELIGTPTDLIPTVRVGDDEISYFKQSMTVIDSNSAVLFNAEVVCRRSTYVGVQRP